MIDFNKKIQNSSKFQNYIPSILLDKVGTVQWRYTGIYKITNRLNGKCYIGQAVDIRKRLVSHVAAFERGDKHVIYTAIGKYGIENFEAQILVIINTFGKTQDEIKKELNALESFYINLYDSYKCGYNMTPGGDCGRLGFKHTKETIEKIRKAHLNYRPKCADIASRHTYGYDLLNRVFLEGESITDISHKCTGADYRSIGQICNNNDWKSGGRFIVAKRYLFSFDKQDLLHRIDFLLSGERAKAHEHRKPYKRHGRFQQKNQID